MKKAAIITASVILLVVLIGLNYLLWDNSEKKQDIESLETLEETRQQNFQDLYDDYKNANLENQALLSQIAELEQIIADSQIEIDALEQEKLDVYLLVGVKNTMIQQYQRHADADYYREIVEQWIGSINARDYFDAYSSHDYVDVFNERTNLNHTVYALKFNNIESIEIDDFKVRTIDVDVGIDEDAKNRIIFDALFNIELLKDEEGFPVNDEMFTNGINHFVITMAFDRETWTWKIWAID